MFGSEMEPDFDVVKIGESLEEGYYRSGLLCEGCGIYAVSKQNGRIMVAIYDEKEIGSDEPNWIDYKIHISIWL